MKVLLDECVPRKLKRLLPAHSCQTVPEAGYAGKQIGELLDLAEGAGFEVFLTLDRGMAHQQNLTARRISLILLRAKSSRLSDLRPLVPSLLDVLQKVRPGSIEKIGT